MHKSLRQGISLMVQWLKLLASTAGLIPGCETKILHAPGYAPPKKRFEADLCKLYESRDFFLLYSLQLS